MEENFEIIYKVVHGINIAGYVLKSIKDGTEQKVSTEAAAKLALSNRIVGATAVLNSENGRYVMLVEQGIENIPVIRNVTGNKIELLERIVDDTGVCIGYNVKDEKGKISKLSIKKVWDLALGDKVNGAKAIIAKTHKVLVSTTNKKLSDMTSIKN